MMRRILSAAFGSISFSKFLNMHHNGKGVIPIANTLEDLLKLADQYSASMEKLLQTSKKYRSYQKMALTATQEFKSGLASIKNVSNDASNGIGKINQKISDTISKAKLGKKALDLMVSGVKNGANQQVQEFRFNRCLAARQPVPHCTSTTKPMVRKNPYWGLPAFKMQQRLFCHIRTNRMN
ncbi:MAG: hypothetical protein E6579_15830 [Clostridium sp.]|uniref:hypothetical protein n=1 Tax=Faecalispora jeddahensis TaxID=1414721 RepID=UPI0028B21778|nr:hypothetical protein [Faecalispora jeddahensis]MDU6308113.1 hypothetical protein [Clostridium sp.]